MNIMNSQTVQTSESSKFNLRCPFCGEINEFNIEEIYEISHNGKKLKEKYCTFCGEPLIVRCETCTTTFSLNENFQKNPFIQIGPSFWEPQESIMDSLLPTIEKKLNDYSHFANTLKSEDFRLRQKEFLQNLPKLNEKASLLLEDITTLAKLSNMLHLSKESKNVIKGIEKVQQEISEILNSIDPNYKDVIEKKAKQLKKHVIFMDFIPNLEDLMERAKLIRELEISQEKESLKPGYEKLTSHLLVDSSFYRIICPNCNNSTFYINKQIYQWDHTLKQLKYLKKLPSLSGGRESLSDQTTNITLDVNLHLEIPKQYDFHGRVKFILNDKKEEVIGRNFIREIDFVEEESEEILYDQKDPLGRISNKQFSLKKVGPNIILKAMPFDERRVGTFLNNLATDIRITNPDGVTLTSGDTIIIPLINEPNNPNILKITVKLD